MSYPDTFINVTGDLPAIGIQPGDNILPPSSNQSINQQPISLYLKKRKKERNKKRKNNNIDISYNSIAKEQEQEQL